MQVMANVRVKCFQRFLFAIIILRLIDTVIGGRTKANCAPIYEVREVAKEMRLRVKTNTSQRYKPPPQAVPAISDLEVNRLSIG